jgi:hypothetical protein
MRLIFKGGNMKADYDKIKANNFFSYNYYQWATPRTELEAKRFALIKAWRKVNREVKQNKEAV